MRHEHAKSIAEKIAIDEYGHLFRDLPQDVQETLLDRGYILAKTEILRLVGQK